MSDEMTYGHTIEELRSDLGALSALIIHWVRRLARRAYLGDLHLCF
jgi:hypothetical protein